MRRTQLLRVHKALRISFIVTVVAEAQLVCTRLRRPNTRCGQGELVSLHSYRLVLDGTYGTMRLLIVPQSPCRTNASAKCRSEHMCCCCSPLSPLARENQTMAVLQHSINLHLNTACSGVQADLNVSMSGGASEDSSVTSTVRFYTSCCLHAHAATRPSRKTLCITELAPCSPKTKSPTST